MADPEAFEVYPVMRIYDVERAKAFYVGFLGFQVDWEGGMGEGAAYIQISRGNFGLPLREVGNGRLVLVDVQRGRGRLVLKVVELHPMLLYCDLLGRDCGQLVDATLNAHVKPTVVLGDQRLKFLIIELLWDSRFGSSSSSWPSVVTSLF